jgi:excisionase family DNA binding protein
MTETKSLLTIDETAKYLSCTPTTVRRMLRRGELRGVKFGKFWRVPREVLRRVEAGALTEQARSATAGSTPSIKGEGNPLAKALAMVQARDAATPARPMRTAGVDDAASDIRAMREEQTP